MNSTVSDINIYPVKSLGSVTLNTSLVGRRGLDMDRRFVLVDGNGMFLTQRQNAQLASIKMAITADNIVIECNGRPPLHISTENIETLFAKPRTVRVWDSSVEAFVATESINKWFSVALGAEIYLAHMPQDSERRINARFNSGSDIVSFADAYPLLLTNRASLEELNSKLEDPIPMDRFRPNVVVEGDGAFDEDHWKHVRIGDVDFRVTKPSARCVVTTIDQNSAERHKTEPLKTLAGFRKASKVYPDNYGEFGLGGNDVLFGIYLVPETRNGRIAVGDAVSASA